MAHDLAEAKDALVSVAFFVSLADEKRGANMGCKNEIGQERTDNDISY